MLSRTAKLRGPDTSTLVSVRNAFTRCRTYGGQNARCTGESAE